MRPARRVLRRVQATGEQDEQGGWSQSDRHGNSPGRARIGALESADIPRAARESREVLNARSLPAHSCTRVRPNATSNSLSIGTSIARMAKIKGTATDMNGMSGGADSCEPGWATSTLVTQ